MLEIDGSSMSQNISKAQAHKSIMDAHNLWAQRQNFIKRYDFVTDITAWAQEHFIIVSEHSKTCLLQNAKLYHAIK